MIPSAEVRELTLKDYVGVVRSRMWIIYFLFIAVLTGVILLNVFAPKIYETKTTILISGGTMDLLGRKSKPLADEGGRGFIQTQLGLLHSQYIADRVIKRLNLAMTAEDILKKVNIQKVYGTNMFIFSVKGKDPLLITDIANTWVREYIQQGVERKIGTTKYGMTRLEDEIAATQTKIQTGQQQLQAFEKEYGVLTEREEHVARLKAQKNKIEKTMVDLSARFKEKHPKMVSLNEQLAEVNEELKAENEGLLKLQQKLAEYNVIKKKTNAYQNIYDELLVRSRELDTMQGLVLSNVRIVDIAQVPKEPVKIPIQMQIMALLGSIFGGILLCFILEYLDSSLKAAEEVEFYAKMPFLGYVPSIGDEFKKHEVKDFNLVCSLKPYSQIADAFRNIEVSLRFAVSGENPLRTILLTSTVDGEGKTFVASNLGITLARAKEPTLIVDADMRGGGLSKVYKAQNEKGLSSVLKGECSVEEAEVATPIPDLFLLPSGPVFPSPADLLESEETVKVLKKIGERYRKVIIDVPALKTGTEALILADKCDGLMHVIKEGATSYRDIAATRKRVEGKIKIIGAVLNNAEIKKDLNYYFLYFQDLGRGKMITK